MQHAQAGPGSDGAETPSGTTMEEQADVRGGEEPEAPEDKGAMIALMKRYAETKNRLEEEEENARVYLQIIQDEIRESLAPLRGEIEHARLSMEFFVQERNGGKSFAVPALGTVYTQNRVVGKIVDPDEFLKALRRTDPEKAEALFERKLNASRARQEAERAFRDDGEIVAGADVEQVSILCFKPTAASSSARTRTAREKRSER